jgi:hypothetical protein
MEEQIRGKTNRYAAYAERARRDFAECLQSFDFAPLAPHPTLLAA